MKLHLLYPLFVALFACDSTPEAPPDTTQPVEVEVASPEVTPIDEVAETTTPETSEEIAETTSPEVVAETTDVVEQPEVVLPSCASDTDCAPGTLCIDEACVCDPTPVSYAGDVAPLFASTCGSSCHVVNPSTGGSAGLNLKATFSHAELVNTDASQCHNARADQLRVVPGDVRKSYLMDKLLGTNMCTGVRMPKGVARYTAERLALVGRWICQGALDN